MKQSKQIIECGLAGCGHRIIVHQLDGKRITSDCILDAVTQQGWIEQDGEYFCPVCIRAAGRNLRQYVQSMSKQM